MGRFLGLRGEARVLVARLLCGTTHGDVGVPVLGVQLLYRVLRTELVRFELRSQQRSESLSERSEINVSVNELLCQFRSL